MQSDAHKGPPFMTRETPMAEKRRVGAWVAFLGSILLALSFYIMPASRTILMENEAALGFALSMLGLGATIYGFFLLSRREERTT